MATELERLIVRIEADVSQLKRGLRDAEGVAARSSTRIGRGFRGLRRSLGTITRSVGLLSGALAGLGLAFGGRALVQASDTFQLLQSRLKLVTDNSQELARVTDTLFESSQNTRVSFEATANLYARLARSSEELGVSQNDLLGITETINQAIIVSGASATEASAGLIQFSQGLASGALRGDELRSVLEQLPRLARAIADGLGITVGELRELGSQGALSGEAILRAIQSQAGKIRDEFAQIDRTVGQALEQLSNSFLRTFGEAGQAAGSTEALTAAIDELRAVVEDPAFQSALIGIVTFFVNVGTEAANAIRSFQEFRTEFQSLIGIAPDIPTLGGDAAAAARNLKSRDLARARGEDPDAAPAPIVIPALTPTSKSSKTPERFGPEVGDVLGTLQAIRDENEALALQVRLFGESEAEIERQLALLQAKQEFGEIGVRTLDDEINKQAVLSAQLEAQQRARDELNRIRETEITITEELTSSTLDLAEAGGQFGQTITSALEDAIVNGEKLSDVLDGLETDMLRLLTRILVLEPIEQGLRTGLGAFQTEGAGGPGGLEGLIGGGLGAAADLFPSSVEGVGLGTFNKINPIAREDVGSEELSAIFGSLTGAGEEAVVATDALSFAFEDAKGAAQRAAIGLGDATKETLSETVATIGMTGAAQTAAIALSSLAASATAAAAAQQASSFGNAAGAGPGGGASSPGGALVNATGFASGLPFGGLFAAGGPVSGPGTGTSDSIPAMLSDGEFVVRASMARDHGALLEAINSGRLRRLAEGGLVRAQTSPAFPDMGVDRPPVTINIMNPRDSRDVMRAMAQIRGSAAEIQDRAFRRDN